MGQNEKRFWLEYSADGRVRYCKTHAPVAADDSGKRVIRLFGGRKTEARETNVELCEPESCPEYQQRQCNLSGRFLFFIPGIRSIRAFELHNSFYAMSAAIQKLETSGSARWTYLGPPGPAAHDVLSDQEVDGRGHIDDSGQAVRVSQWIIELEAPVDATALLQFRQTPRRRGGHRAGAVREPGARWCMPEDTPRWNVESAPSVTGGTKAFKRDARDAIANHRASRGCFGWRGAAGQALRCRGEGVAATLQVDKGPTCCARPLNIWRH